ncbi:MAG: hypothetical protein GY696_08500 [Gammaproteobacteria bacterium]|nr:hypothetical protein [Gammaproteobacteria bacterium]
MKAAETAKKDRSSFHAQADGILKFNPRGGTTSRGQGASWKHQQEPANSRMRVRQPPLEKPRVPSACQDLQSLQVGEALRIGLPEEEIRPTQGKTGS